MKSKPITLIKKTKNKIMRYILLIISICCCSHLGYSQQTESDTSKQSSINLAKNIRAKNKSKLDSISVLKEELRNLEERKGKDVTEYELTNTYSEAVARGSSSVNSQNYEEAVHYYFAAEAFEPSQRKQVKNLVDKAFVKITELKDKAELANKKAQIALLESEIAKEIAVAEQKRADKEAENARKAEKKAVDALDEAKRERDKARIAEKKAKEEERKAKEQECIAKGKEQEAKVQKAKADRLKVKALAKTVALKSSAMKYDNQDTIKALLALEAYKMQMVVNQKFDVQNIEFNFVTINKDSMVDVMCEVDTITNTAEQKANKLIAPEIYTAVHDALIKLNDENYDEIKDRDLNDRGDEIMAHNGAIRNIIQSQNDDKIIYTSGSDGRLIQWRVNQWYDTKKPKFEGEGIKVIQNRESIDLAFDAKTDQSQDLIALGGKFRPIEFIEKADESSAKIKSNFRENWARLWSGASDFHRSIKKNSAYDFDVKKKTKFIGAYELNFYKDKLYFLSKNGTFNILYDDEIKTYSLKALKKVGKKSKRKSKKNDIPKLLADKMAVHPNGKIVAIGYSSGLVEVYDVNNFGTPIDSMLLQKYGGITALTFDDTEGDTIADLAIGTNKGYFTIIPQQIGLRYQRDFKKNPMIKAHELIISDMDFGKHRDSKGEYNSIAVGSYDGTVSVWDLKLMRNAQTKKDYEPLRFDDKNTWVTSVEFVQTDKKGTNQLVAGYADGNLKFWCLDVHTLVVELQSLMEEQEIKQSQRQQYHLNDKAPNYIIEVNSSK